ncbi:hypothetical protein FRC06_007201 [Ceratobasidium sp. 370]|nr:hypothetical protein FRC06_007201 [Ceratobasidium sp. 370]
MNASRSRDRWAIGLAPRALKELQKFKRDRNSLDIVWKKIRELSFGQFTLDNQTAIIGTTSNIPIYRARVSSDLRIIYHVDVVSDKTGEFDHQGKTTALIYKMQSIEASTTKPIRQLFVTRSPVLTRHVESSFSRLVDSVNLEPEVAAELDLGTPTELDQALVEFDNEADLRDDLPPRFSLLDNSHFPLFISFEKLCSLIEEDIYEKHGKQKQYFWSAKPMCQRSMIGYKYGPIIATREIYWPQFKYSDRFGLNPFLVYSEIVGVIKGYSEVLGCAHGFLSKDQYILGGVAHKVSAHLDVGVKGQIYSMFEAYRKLKATRFELDHADKSHYIHEFFTRRVPAYEATIDFLYVDEVQDNLMTDIRLLRGLCRNVDHTYWGGDTAQTILAGSAFRIKDLGSYIYNEVYDRVVQSQRVPASSTPSKFELTVNYRSHEGIIQCAASVIDSLYNLFPESLDHLARETAANSSTEYLPVVLTDTGTDISVFENFLLNSISSLGAQQAILVRSEELEERLTSRMSKFCPILTIAKSKGLEFDDILLYDFFAESESPLAWEFVHGIWTKTHRNERDSIPPLSLCNELKLLYVAMTRARRRCWIWDRGDVIDAMKQFWLARGLIATTSVSAMIDWGSTSNSAQWLQKGQEYFANGMYKLAAGCFERSGNGAETSYRIAMAYYEMSRAKLEMLRNDTEESRAQLCTAAEKLSSCAQGASGQSARHLWFHTAICLELAREIPRSADAFVNAGLYERAIRPLLDLNYVKHTVKILLEHGHNLEFRVREEFMDHCRQHYFKKHNFDALLPLFDNLNEELSYARKHAFWDQLKYLLEYHRRFDELAQVYIEERALVKGLDSFIKAYNHHQGVSSLNEGATVTISYAEWVFTLEGNRSGHALEQLELMVKNILPHEAKLERRRRKDLKLFQTILSGRLNPSMAKEWDENDSEERPRKTLLFYEIIQDMGWLKSRALGTVISRLNTWGNYNAIVVKILEASEFSTSSAARCLFGFRPSSSGLYTTPSYIVAEGSLLARSAANYVSTIQRNSHKELLVPARWIDQIIKNEFRRCLNDRLREIYFGLIRSGWTSLHDFKPRVRSFNTPGPISRVTTSDGGFKNRLNIATAAIQAFTPICHISSADKSSSTNPSLPHLWVRRLFDIIYPMSGIFEEFTPVPRGQPSYLGTQTCIRQYLTETSSADLSTFVIVNSLVTQLAVHDPDVHSILHAAPGVFPENRLFEERTINALFNWEKVNGLTVVTFGLRKILRSSEGPLDAAVLVHLVEAITCELLFHTRAAQSTSQNGFSGLILPYSWARLLSKRYARSQIVRDTSSMEVFLEVVIAISDGLKYNRHRWWVREELLSKKLDLAYIFRLRLTSATTYN